MQHRNLHSPTKLTEFARDFDAEPPDTFFGKFVTRLTSAYNTSYNAVNVAPDTTPSPTAETAASLKRSASSSAANSSNASTSSTPPSSEPNSNSHNLAATSSQQTPPNIPPHDSTSLTSSASTSSSSALDRLPSGVLSRIGNLMTLRSDDASQASHNQQPQLTSYKDTELQRFWMPDAKSKECYECSLKFTTFRRRHHCRLCGQIFCSKCCNQVVPGRIIKCSGDLKVCTYCSKIVLSYLKTADLTSDLRPDLQALKVHLSEKLDDDSGGGSNRSRNVSSGDRSVLAAYSGGIDRSSLQSISSTATSSSLAAQRKVSVGYQEERLVSVPTRTKPGLFGFERRHDDDTQQTQQYVVALHERMCIALQHQAATSGAELVHFVMNNTQLAENELQAVEILVAMLERGFLVSLGSSTTTAATKAPLPLSSDDTDEYGDEWALALIMDFGEQNMYRLRGIEVDAMEQSAESSTSTYLLDMNVASNSAHLTHRSGRKSTQRSEHGCGGDGGVDSANASETHSELDISLCFSASKEVEMQNSLMSTAGSKPLVEAFCDHEELLLSELYEANFVYATILVSSEQYQIIFDVQFISYY